MFFIGVIPVEEPGEDTGFKTDILPFTEIQRMRDELRASGESTSDSFIHEVKKRSDNAWTQWISVGRAGNNDIVLKHTTVSKLHARIRSADEDGVTRYFLTDAGSHSGTKINHVSIEPKKEYEIKNGDHVVFGGVDCHFVRNPLSSEHLHR